MKTLLWPFCEPSTVLRPFALLFLILLTGCASDDPEEPVRIRDVAPNQSFTMVPGDIVRFSEPVAYQMELLSFEDFVKQENTLATATANFVTSVSDGFGDLILYISQNQGDEGPIPFFSGCTPAKISGGPVLTDIFYVIEEVRFVEDAERYTFESIRMRLIVKADNPEFACTY